MAAKSKGLRQLMQDNEHLMRLEKHVLSTGIDVRRDLGSAFGDVGIVPRLVVPELASSFSGPQGTVVHIPLQSTDNKGGRRSLFALQPGQETVAGIYVVEGRIFQRRVIRDGGTEVLRVGDAFTERITDAAGSEVQVHGYKVLALGSKTAAIYLQSRKAEDGPGTGDLVNAGDGWCWFCNMASQWWCGFQCLPDIPDDLDDIIFA